MATNTELKNQIDSQIKNKTAPASITKSNVADNIKQVIDYVDQEILTIPAGPTGPQGVQGNTGLTGPQGNPGPIGPAGLTWKGQWVSGTSYLKDDAVGHNGASWFCTTNTSGIIPPNSDIANWALLASQGAQGIQGPTGLTGPQGPSGSSTEKTIGSVLAIPGSKATLQNDINNVNKSGGSEVKLPDTTEVGKEVLFLASNYAGTVSVYVNEAEDIKLSGGSNGISGNQQSIQINANEAYRFIYRTNGYWFYEKIYDVPNNYYQLVSERTTDGTLSTNSNFKYPTEKAVKTYVDNKFTYKSYTALISHGAGNGNPTAIVLENTIGDITWGYEEANSYFATSLGLFTAGKTIILATSPHFPLMKVGLKSNNSNFISLQTDNDSFNNLNLEIRVYN